MSYPKHVYFDLSLLKILFMWIVLNYKFDILFLMIILQHVKYFDLHFH